ncbi:putative phosphate/phosphoenolpyruvate translocator [Cryptosporidium canis]|uniref:Phosphate/phosphoenolpyruvate translocator n=1 Tax=Cryptosporidium canis TaxID=195482 RepID=A0ABQ8P4P7_9CRYT|nr:putative phosphate/phosphoenolpyruvate translocator [Cryptosporidium canis]
MSMYFPYPITMSLVHMVVASVLSHVAGGFVGRQSGGKLRTWSIGELSLEEKRRILVFSMVVAVNIWFSNASLHAVSISLHQMARTTIPLFTMALGILFFKHKYRWMQIPPVMLVIVGVAVTVNGTPELSIYGLSIVLLGCCVSSLKGILAQKLQVESLKINPIVMLQYVGPVASLALGLFSVIFGEAGQILEQKESMDQVLLLTIGLLLVFAGIFAFLLNVLSFMSSSIVSPLAMNIAGNVKQLLTCLVGCLMFGNAVTDKLVFGILLTSLGALWYSLDKQKDFGRRKVRYVKGRYIDRAGLGIPEDGSTKLQSKLSVPEAIEITQIGTFSKAPVIECPEESELSDKEIAGSRPHELLSEYGPFRSRGVPGDTGVSGDTGVPGDSGVSGDPGNPDKPGIPGKPGDPGDPEKPERPGIPGDPEKPERPGKPGDPERPGIPGIPGDPEKPERPGIPGDPEKPGIPGKPGDPERPEKPERPRARDRPSKRENESFQEQGFSS